MSILRSIVAAWRRSKAKDDARRDDAAINRSLIEHERHEREKSHADDEVGHRHGAYTNMYPPA